MSSYKGSVAGTSDDEFEGHVGTFGCSRKRVKSRPSASGELCHACLKPGVLDAWYRGSPVHSPCNLGIRSYLRVIQDAEEEVAAEKKNFPRIQNFGANPSNLFSTPLVERVQSWRSVRRWKNVTKSSRQSLASLTMQR
jgi:Uri superfamily endonuclease